MLAIQEFLRSHNPKSAVRHAVEKWNLEVEEVDDLVLLNYHQFKSPQGVREVEECRGLILERPSFRVVARGLYRFYNAGEPHAASFPLERGTLQEKRDGSILTVYKYRGQWHVATRGKIFAEGPVNGGTKTFRDLFWETVHDQMPPKYHSDNPPFPDGLCFSMELTSPENRVVTPYKNNQLCLLCARETDGWTELGPSELDDLAGELGIFRPREYPFKDWDHVQNLLNEIGTLEEGFVVVDYRDPVNGNFPRIKVKNQSWRHAQSLIGDGMSYPKALRIFLEGRAEEFLAYYPEYGDLFVEVESKLCQKALEIDGVFKQVQEVASNRGEFAAEAVKHPFSKILFSLLDGKADGAYQQLISLRRDKETGEISRSDLSKLWDLVRGEDE